LKGGVFIDSDAMIEKPLDYIAKDCDLFSVQSLVPNCIFQGFIGSVPKNNIIYKALQDAYNISPEDLKKDYLLLTKHMFDIIKKEEDKYTIKLFNEKWLNNGQISETYDQNTDEVVLKHYPGSGVVPE
jgi:hypothetical protein